MLEFLQYLIALSIVFDAVATGARPSPAGMALTGATIVGFAVAARVAGVLAARATARGAEAAALARMALLVNAGRVAALAAFWVMTHVFGSVRIPDILGIAGWVLVPTLVQLVPFLLLCSALTWGLHPISAAMRAGPRTAAAAIAFELRQAILPLVPVLVIVTLYDLSKLAAATSPAGRAIFVINQLPAVQAFILLGFVFLALLALPFAMRLMLRAKPLPPGPLRERLTAYALRTKLRTRDILVWPTGGQVLNASVVGVIGPCRYVMITDGLIETLDEDEIEAVFAHEAGHAKRGHLLLFFGFTAVFALIGIFPGTANLLGALPLPPLLRSLVLVLVWMGVFFGWISRRFEQEADVYGIETLPLPGDARDGRDHPFARAMERIGREVGAIREVTGFRHFSIADRVAFVRRYIADAAVRRRFKNGILLLRAALLTLICGFVLLAAVRIPGEIAAGRRILETGVPVSVNVPAETVILTYLHAAVDGKIQPANRAQVFKILGELAALSGRNEESVRWFRESVANGFRGPQVLAEYATLLEKTGHARGAALLWTEIAEREDLPDEVRETARKRAAVETPR